MGRHLLHLSHFDCCRRSQPLVIVLDMSFSCQRRFLLPPNLGNPDVKLLAGICHLLASRELSFQLGQVFLLAVFGMAQTR